MMKTFFHWFLYFPIYRLLLAPISEITAFIQQFARAQTFACQFNVYPDISPQISWKNLIRTKIYNTEIDNDNQSDPKNHQTTNFGND